MINEINKLATDINRTNSGGWTLMHVAARFGNTDGIEEILQKKGFDINAKDKNGDTPRAYVIMSLIAMGATVSAHMCKNIPLVQNSLEKLEWVAHFCKNYAKVYIALSTAPVSSRLSEITDLVKNHILELDVLSALNMVNEFILLNNFSNKLFDVGSEKERSIITDKIVSTNLRQYLVEHYPAIKITEHSTTKDVIELIKSKEQELYELSFIQKAARAIAYRTCKDYRNNSIVMFIPNLYQATVLGRQIADIALNIFQNHSGKLELNVDMRSTIAQAISNELRREDALVLRREKNVYERASVIKNAITSILPNTKKRKRDSDSGHSL